MSVEVLYDVDAALLETDWRQNIAWPVSLTQSHALVREGWQAFWKVADLCARGGSQRDLLLLAGARIVWQCLALAEAASIVQSVHERGWRLKGLPSIVQFLVTGTEDSPDSSLAPSPFKTAQRVPLQHLRRIGRSLALSAPSAWTRLFTDPDAVALSHNPMMHAFAHTHRYAVQFIHADELLHKAIQDHSTAATAPKDWISDTAEVMASALLGDRPLAPVYRSRFMRVAMPFIKHQLDQADQRNAALRQTPKLPSNIWIGGQLSARYIAVEARRRGAHVTGFEHGWGAACEEAAHLTAYAELAVVDRYVAMTSKSAARLRASAAHRIASPRGKIEFIAGAGDAETRRLHLVRNAKPARGRPTVVYAPTIIAGFRQFLPPLLPDVVHLDWQFRLCETLMRLPINFICRPHPEGVFRGRVHPLNQLGKTAVEPFEKLITDADVFVFDFQQSTTFGRALCSDRVIVLVDLGTPAFDAETEAAIRRRCRVVATRFDEFNRPHVDIEAFRDAVLTPQSGAVDNSYFRTLMLDSEE